MSEFKNTDNSGHTLESSYWTGDIHDVELELENKDKLQNKFSLVNSNYESVANFLDDLYNNS